MIFSFISKLNLFIFKELFFFIFITIPFSVLCQSPGGVSSPKYWYNTSQGEWKEIYSNDKKFPATPASTKDTLNINFHSALKFQKNEYFLNKIADLNLKNQQTLYAVFHPFYEESQTKPESKHFLQLRYYNHDYTSLNFDSILKKRIFSSDKYSPNFQLDNFSKAKENALKIVGFESSTSVNNSIWGTDPDTLMIGFSGFLPELIIYDRKLNTKLLERERIETYLAIKYGITLDLEKYSYVGSDSHVLLEKGNMNRYKYRICGIGRDDKSGLWQYRTNTSYEESNLSYTYHSNGNEDFHKNRSLTVGFTDKNKSNHKNNEFVFWGDDGGKVRARDTAFVMNSSSPQKDSAKIEIIERNWFLYNQHKISDLITFKMSGKLMDSLKKEEYVHFLLKKDKQIDKTSFFLLKDTLNSLVKDSIKWNEKTPFTFGRVMKLKEVYIMLCHTECETTIDKTEYIYFKELLIKFKGGYKYRTFNSEIVNCDKEHFPYFWNTKMNSKQVEVYFKGGIAPYEIKLYNSEKQLIANTNSLIHKESLEINKPHIKHTYEEINICVITTQLTGPKLNKEYKVVITDAINQTISIPVIIK